MNINTHPTPASIRGDDSATSLAEEICKKIRERILTWEIASNQVLVEGTLAREFNVSKTPVREALNQLRHEGLLNGLPRVGYQVTPITIEDIKQVFELRVLLEGAAAVLATQRATDDELLAVLEEDRARAKELRENGADHVSYLMFHDSFHLGIARLCGNERLAKFISQLLRDGTRIRSSDPRMGVHSLAEEQQTNARLVNVMLTRDSEAARTEMQEHILAGEKRVFSRLGGNITL